MQIEKLSRVRMGDTGEPEQGVWAQAESTWVYIAGNPQAGFQNLSRMKDAA